MNGEQVTLGDILIRILQVPAILEGQILHRAGGDENLQAHAESRAF